MILAIVSSGAEPQILELYQTRYFELLPKLIHIKEYKIMLTVMLTIANICGCNPNKFKPLLNKYELLENISTFLSRN
jgi:hypothetical protein